MITFSTYSPLWSGCWHRHHNQLAAEACLVRYYEYQERHPHAGSLPDRQVVVVTPDGRFYTDATLTTEVLDHAGKPVKFHELPRVSRRNIFS